MQQPSRRQLLTLPGALAAAAPPPNVILILADDLGYGDLGCYGSQRNRTPHLDRLAAEGARFTDHYSCSPVCSPARAGLMTGLVPERTGVTGVLRDQHDDTGLALNLKTMADYFRASGRKTALIGKWHLGMSAAYHPNRRGFDYFWGFLNGTIDYYTHLSLGGGARGRRTTYENDHPLRLEGYFPGLATARAVRFIEENRSSPYFLYLPLALPHTPLQVPDSQVEPFKQLPPAQARYAAMVASLDNAVGQVRSALDRTGQSRNTVVVFLSDNGWVKKPDNEIASAGSNGPLRGGKYELFEGGIRVPCIVHWPGLTKPGSLCHAPSWFCDWLPTLTGVPSPDGISLKPFLSGSSAPSNRVFRWSFSDPLVKTPPSRAVRRGNWKYLQVAEARFLFDLQADTGESKDLIASNPGLAREIASFSETAVQ